MATSEPQSSRPQVAMVVADAAAIDGRVRRQALALVRAGFDVTLLTVGEGVSRTEGRLGAVRVIRLVVPWTMRDARRERLARRRAWVPPIGPRDTLAEQAARARFQAARLALASSEMPALTGAVVALRQQTSNAGTVALRALRKALRVGWRGLDSAVNRVPTCASWRHRLPETYDYDAVFGPALERLGADALYVHGVELVGVVARVSAWAQRRGRRVPWVYDAPDNLADRQPGSARSRRDLAASAALEKEHVRYAARVVTSSDPLADVLQRQHRLSCRPTVVTADDVAPIAALFVELLGVEGLKPRPDEPRDDVKEHPVVPSRATGEGSYVGIGPANMAGQAWAWAKALERHLPGATTEVIVVDRGSPLVFEADEIVSTATYTKDAGWAQALESRALETWTHALLEAGRPIFGLRHGRNFSGDVPVLRAVGVEVGLLMHGSEVRNPRRHAPTTPWSPFRDPDEELTARLQIGRDKLFPVIDAFDGPKLVSTPDLLVDVPGAIWLPVVVDLDAWRNDQPVMQREVPIVLHAPSRASLKGSVHVENAMRILLAEGLVEYRRIEGVAPEDMPAYVAQADIVLDQFSVGIYGVMAAQAMAAGRVVVSHLTDEFRSLCPEPVPIVEATPDQIVDVVRGLIEDRDRAVAVAQAGRRYVEDIHSGERSARVLIDALGLQGTGPT